jgi:hypothetical protein
MRALLWFKSNNTSFWSHKLTDLLREAEEEIRRETIEGTAKKAAPYFIGLIVLALVGGAGLQYYRAEQSKALDKASVQYYAAMDILKSGDLDGGIKALDELTKKSPKGFAALAAIQKAAVLQEKGDAPNALAAFDSAVKIAKDEDLKAIAQIRAAYIASGLETREKLNARLDPIINGKGAFVNLARELKASAAWAAKDYKAAKDEYSLLQIDPASPEGLRARAQQAVAVIDAQAQIAPDLAEFPDAQQQGAQQGQAISQEQAMAQAKAMAQAQATQQAQTAQAAQQKGVEIGPDGKRIVRLPPGVKLPPGTKIPPDVRVIETPLPAGAIAKMQANQQTAKNDLQKQIDAERKKALAAEQAVTKAQQQKVDEITNQNNAATEKKGE